MVCLSTRPVPKPAHSAVFSARTLIRSTVLCFYGSLLSIVSLEVFAEVCDLGQDKREGERGGGINNSECEETVFRANLEKVCHFLVGEVRGGRSRSGEC